LCVFANKLTSAIILAYVNNLVFITYTKLKIATLKALVFNKYKYCNLRAISYYLGICIRRDRSNRAIKLSIELYINKLTKDYNYGYVTYYNSIDVRALKLKLRRSNNVCKD
jgi:hypothetical protein